jgi:ATP-dependent Lhr-like helicase
LEFFDRPRDYWEIKDAGNAVGELIPALWDQVWKGRLTADSWEPVRHFVPHLRYHAPHLRHDAPAKNSITADGYSPFSGASGYRRIPKALRDRWKQGSPLPGRWYSLDREPLPQNTAEDPWLGEELDRDRVRLLLRRWGVLCRPLLERENSALSWSRLLPAMRRMELAGELVVGRFFSGVNSLQFASPAILSDLEEAEHFAGTKPPLFWMNAADPASPAGLAVEGLDPRLPARSPHNRLYYAGTELIAVTTKNGKNISIFIPPEDPSVVELIGLIKIKRLRNVNPEKKLVIETINNVSAAASPYSPLFIKQGFINDRGKLFLW